ncbi:hypothetical protein QNN00_01590 [Bacillus velezensis]|nr:hypothetical protein [Bacillus velezensis]
MTDNFFTIGGHSLKAMMMTAKSRSTFKRSAD